MTPAELREIGERLYGRRWQTKLARRLKVDPRTVRRWLSGDRKISPLVADYSLLVWKLDHFGRSLVDCLNNIRFLEDHGIRFVAVTQALDTDIQNPASRFLLHVLGAAAEFERSLIRERTQAGRLRYQQDFDAGKVGKTVYSKSRKNLPIGRPKRIFNRERVIELRRQGASMRAIAKQLGVGVGTVTRTLRERSKIS
jgi:DNA invertase Pin-like site-specific DNA recombinase